MTTTTRWLRTLAGAAALALAACGAGSPAPSQREEGVVPPPVVQPPPEQSGPAVVLGLSAEAPGGAYASTLAFPLAATLELYVVADWSHVDAAGAERLVLRKPSGLVHYQTLIPFTGATGSDRSVTVMPDGSLRAVYVLQVAGTEIDQYQMVGTWSVTVTLDGTATAATASFDLQ